LLSASHPKTDFRPLTRAALPRDTIEQARFLLGRLVVHHTPDGMLSGRIVETEAYPPGDAAMHAYRGVTPRNRSLFLRHGHAYVYICYGTSLMLNVSSEAAGIGAGVLIRALEPLTGIPQMMQARATTKLRDLARGPGRLAMAMRIDKRLDGVDLCTGGALHLAEDDALPPRIDISMRIGLTKDAHRLLRFSVAASRFVSGKQIRQGEGSALDPPGPGAPDPLA
jgi:DNA-3-methyladenine glycosylase